ncbi:hypothetical protein CSUB01_00365 [Colletotrichum sublineola]|uniref:Uncharacterized protein n=1 Tax=Colletotrichum sublineola TaxID=1173701 RepID=A0A066X727_COLSU|nr:hypothetical protein CSUB01_00365 [Colletotrichum sublineola]
MSSSLSQLAYVTMAFGSRSYRKYCLDEAATALETNLTSLESRLDALLAAFEAKEKSDQGGTKAPQNKNSKEDGTIHHAASDRDNEDSSGSNERARKS